MRSVEAQYTKPGKRAGKIVDHSHPGKKRADRLVAGSLKARAVTAEKQRGQAFLRKLKAEGTAWWTTMDGQHRVKVELPDPKKIDTYTNVLAVIGNRLRVGMVADKKNTMIVGNGIIYDSYDYVPFKQIVGVVLEIRKRKADAEMQHGETTQDRMVRLFPKCG